MAKTPPFSSLDPEPGHKRTTWETIVITTPVVLTVIATVLAGISSSEMTQGQYYRSIAAQMQSKVSDQWGYFQAKKLRAEQCTNTAEIIRGYSQTISMDSHRLRQITARLIDAMGRVKDALAAERPPASAPSTASVVTELDGGLNDATRFFSQLGSNSTQAGGSDDVTNFLRGDIPPVTDQPIGDQSILNAIRAVDSHVPETDLEQQAGAIPQDAIDHSIEIADDNLTAFDKSLDAINQRYSAIERACAGMSQAAANFEQTLRQTTQEIVPAEAANAIAATHDLASQISSAVSVARLNFNANRYQREAEYNQILAQLYEVEVRRQGFISERHRLRSKQFFFGMLGAQAGVTIATFSLAVRRRNLLWGLAASAGLAAVTFAAYVYLFV